MPRAGRRLEGADTLGAGWTWLSARRDEMVRMCSRDVVEIAEVAFRRQRVLARDCARRQDLAETRGIRERRITRIAGGGHEQRLSAGGSMMLQRRLENGRARRVRF